jgi:hypothetical protein
LDPDSPRRVPPSLAPEHDWAAASLLVRPALRPLGTSGTDGRDPRVTASGGGPGKPVVRPGPTGLPVVYVLPGAGFEVVVGVDHVLAWGVGVDRIHTAAMANLTAWSTAAAWEVEVSGERRIVWSDSGGGMDAARILLAEVRAHLEAALAPARHFLVGIPERDLLIAAGLTDGDDDFAALFAAYVADRARAADEPIDARVFELVGGELTLFEADQRG